jgi:hypothetical protein
MSAGQLKSLVETGHYRPSPELIAEAMLERPGVRALLDVESDSRSLTPAGRSHRDPGRTRPAV